MGAEPLIGNNNLDNIQTTLTVVGLVPGVGEFADVANAAISLARGDYGDAALNLAAAIPVLGTLAVGAKVTNTVIKEAKVVNAVEGTGKADFIVTPHGEVLPSTKGALQENLTKMTQQGGKYYGNDSKGPLRVRMEKAHPEDPNYMGPKNPDHTVDHIHIERRKNITSGPWGSDKTTIPQSLFDDDLWLP